MTVQPSGRMVVDMFAPYCPTCRTRRLLGPSRIAATAWYEGGGISLRCVCGTIVDADARPPGPPEELRPAS